MNEIAVIRAHAKANYGQDGWDIVVECYTDSDIAAEIEKAGSVEAAIGAIAREVGAMAEYRDDIRGWGGCFD